MKMKSGKTAGLKTSLQHKHMLHTNTHQWEYTQATIVTGREQKKRPVRAFWLLLLLFLVRGGVSWGLGGVLVPVPKIGPPKTECPPLILPSWPFTSSPPSYVSVCVPVLLSAACCLAGATATHTETVRRLSRHKNLQGCSLFPWPSLSTIQIDIFGGTEKSKKN